MNIYQRGLNLRTNLIINKQLERINNKYYIDYYLYGINLFFVEIDNNRTIIAKCINNGKKFELTDASIEFGIRYNDQYFYVGENDEERIKREEEEREKERLRREKEEREKERLRREEEEREEEERERLRKKAEEIEKERLRKEAEERVRLRRERLRRERLRRERLRREEEEIEKERLRKEAEERLRREEEEREKERLRREEEEREKERLRKKAEEIEKERLRKEAEEREKERLRREEEEREKERLRREEEEREKERLRKKAEEIEKERLRKEAEERLRRKEEEREKERLRREEEERVRKENEEREKERREEEREKERIRREEEERGRREEEERKIIEKCYLNVNISIVTPAKVASATVFHTIKKSNKYKVTHNHSLLFLKDIILNKKNTLIIVGVRNPIKRNFSYILANYKLKFDGSSQDNKLKWPDYKDKIDEKKNGWAVKTKKVNNYMGDNSCYISPELTDEQFIKEFFKCKIHKTFNYWFEEFFEITGIDKIGFDKKKGFNLYNFPNNNKIMIYTTEKLNDNLDEICKYLKIDNKIIIKNNNNISKLYKNIKKKNKI